MFVKFSIILFGNIFNIINIISKYNYINIGNMISFSITSIMCEKQHPSNDHHLQVDNFFKEKLILI